MSIRALIKTSNMAQLCLVLLLGLCTGWLGRSLYEINGLLHDYHHLESLLAEIGGVSRENYRAAHDYISTGDTFHLERWRHLLRVERGEAPRSSTAQIAPGERRSLTSLVNDLEMTGPVHAQVQSIVAQLVLLESMTETAVRGALKSGPAASTAQARQDRQAALLWVHDNGLARIPDSIAEAARNLGDKQRGEFLARLGEREVPLRWTLVAVLAGLALLGSSVLGNAYIFQSRIANPLDRVSRYAESVAAGLDPLPLRLRHRDELAVMFASLQRMKGTLYSRIRELREAEQRARRSRQQAMLARSQALTSLELAQRASHVQDDFLRRISHEIRTPLNAIIGMSYLSLQTDLNGVQRNYLAQINKSGSVLLDMVNRILDFSSASEGSIRMERKVFAVADLLRQSVAGLALEKRLRLNFVLAPSIPAVVAGDERHLEEVLRILLDNAVKYTTTGSVDFRILPSGEPPMRKGAIRLLFVVSDTGPGLGEEQWKKLFEPFTLGDESMTRAFSGLGLGLALARQLVNLMGGELKVGSVPGQGSRFSFSVDMERPDASGECEDAEQATDGATGTSLPDQSGPSGLSCPIGLPAPYPPTALPDLPGLPHMPAMSVLPDLDGLAGPLTDTPQAGDSAGMPPVALAVLVVEDNEINAQIARELLEQVGLEVLLAANGQEALDLLENPAHPPLGLVLMDVQMPVMDGLEATRRIRAMGISPVDLPVVAMTAHTDLASRMDGKDVGMNDYLTKPVNPETLYATLEKWLVGGLRRNPARQAHEGGGAAEPPETDRQDASASADDPIRAGYAVQSRQAASASADRGMTAPVAAALPDEEQAVSIVNVESGLATVGDNKTLYFELLQRFVDHYGDSPARLRKMLESGNLKGAARMAHTVKGVAANLGVERICELTRTMEEFLPHNLPEHTVLESFEVEMGRVLDYVRSMGRHACRTASGSGQMAEEHRAALLAFLEDLPRRMERDWGAVESAMEKFSLLADGTPHAEGVAAILTAVKDFDMGGAGCLADSLRDCLLRESGTKA